MYYINKTPAKPVFLGKELYWNDYQLEHRYV